MTKDQEQIFRQAIAAKTAIVISLPTGETWQHCKSRLVAEHDGLLVVEALQIAPAMIEELTISAKPCGVTFKNGSLKVSFLVPIIRAVAGWQTSQDPPINALVMGWPNAVERAERRAQFRIAVPSSAGLSVRVWGLIGREYFKDMPHSSQLVTAELLNLGLGGLGIKLTGNGGQPPKVNTTDRVRIELKSSAGSFVLQGKMREPHQVPKPDIYVSGIAFKMLEYDIENRQTGNQLSKIIGDLQREAIQRNRPDLAPVPIVPVAQDSTDRVAPPNQAAA